MADRDMTHPTKPDRPLAPRPTYMTVVTPGHVARCLKHIRRARKLTVRDAARMAAVSRSAFNRAEFGKPTTAKSLIALSAFIRKQLQDGTR